MDQLTYLIAFLVLMALVAIVPAMVRRWHVPAVVAIMACGILIGPHGLHVLTSIANFIGSGVSGADLLRVVDALGFLGLVFLMALAGVETDLRMLANEKRAVTSLSILTFALPAAAGYLVYWLFDKTNPISAWVYASLFASHSIGIVFPVIREMGLVRSRFGIAVLSSTVITDILSLILLAVCVQLQVFMHPDLSMTTGLSLLNHVDFSWMGAGWFTVAFIAVIILFVVSVLFLVPFLWRAVEWFLPKGDESKVTFFVLVVLLIVLAGELIGVNLIVGAFVAGMAIARTPGFRKADEDALETQLLMLPKHDNIHHKLEAVGFGLMVPFLFLSVGFKADIGVLFGLGEGASATRNLLIAGATVIGLVFSKVMSGWLAMRLSGFGNRQGVCAGLMTVPQLSATIAAAAVALELQLLDEVFFNAIIVLSLATTLPVPTMVRLLIARSGVSFDTSDRGTAAIREATSEAEREHLDMTV
ncbi:MAG: cation:proton antiporter [bacterium]|nr:cation:proton antiporter [bacterium]